MRTCSSVLSRPSLVPALLAALLLSVLTVSPAQAQRITPDYFGMHDANWVDAPTEAVGSANFTTSYTYWEFVETRRGRFNFDRLDAQVAAAQAIGAQPMIVLGRTPKFHSSRSGAKDYYSYMPSMKAWKTWVRKVAGRFGAELDYQIWPEPNIKQNWKGSPAQMAKLTAAASQIIRGVDRRAKVVGPAMTLRLSGQRAAMLRFYEQSVNGRRVHTYLDAIAIDTFPELEGTPEDSYALIRQAKKQLAGIGVRRKPFWNNEINYGVEGAGAPTTTSYPVALQQSYVIRTYALSAAAGMARTYWLGWFSTKTMAVSMTDENGEQAAPGTSYGVVRDWLVGTSFSGCSVDSARLWTCTAKTATTTRRIHWMESQSRSKNVLVRPGTTRIEDQSGVDRTAAHPVGTMIPVSYRPVMVEVLN